MNELEIRELFERCVAALNYRALRLEVRERPLALLLVVESFGRGQVWGHLDVRGWRSILCENDDKSIWRLAELHRLLKVFVVKGWLVVDAGAGTYRLRPDQWPCWPEVSGLIGRRDLQRLNFIPDEDLNSMLALLSQQNASRLLSTEPVTGTEHRLTQIFGTPTAKVSQSENNSQSRSDVHRETYAPIWQPPDPPPSPPKPRVLRSFEAVDVVAGRVGESAKISQAVGGSGSLDPLSNHSRTLDQTLNSTPAGSRSLSDADRVSSMERSPSRVEAAVPPTNKLGRRGSTALPRMEAGDGGHRPPLQMTSVTLCTLDGYIAEKLARHPKGERLRRELAGQSTFTAQAFQRHFERNPDQAREDIGWFLEANNPNARMNTHMATKMKV